MPRDIAPSPTRSLIEEFQSGYQKKEPEEYTLQEYLDLCRESPDAYATPAERLLKAIGAPEVIDTSRDPRLSRIFQNRTIERYATFSDFYGMEEPIMQVVGHLRHAGQGLEEMKQILYLLGPVGGGKSSLAERLKSLMEEQPFYALKHEPSGEISPLNENPLGLFDARKHGERLQEEYGIPPRYLRPVLSPWAAKRLKQSNGNLDHFKVVKLYPSILEQIAISKTEPGDENNQDISALTGKVDIRKLEEFEQNDPDAYSYSGGLCKGNRGVMEFVEMFKAPIKVLHPLLTATQEGHYNGTEAIGAMPFEGVVLAHSNESEWQRFRNDRNNEAFLDRVNVVKVPYNLRVTEEVKIYEKLIRESAMADAPCAPDTLVMLARFSVLTRLKMHENSSIYSKLRVYDGENLKDVDPKAKTIQEYRDAAGVNEGMDGVSTRFAFKVLSKTFNFEAGRPEADPVHLMYVLEQQIKRENLPEEKEAEYLGFIKEYLAPQYFKFLGKEIQTAYLESYADYGQNIFDRYVTYADHWIQDHEFPDPDTGNILDRDALEKELQKIEKPAGIVNPKDFRNEVVNFVLRARASNNGQNPDWRSYAKIRGVIEARIFSNTEELLPVISFGAKGSSKEEKKHEDFVNRMEERGYTKRQVRRLVDWYTRSLKNG